MDGRVKELQLKVSKFAARWNELKPKKLEAADPEAMAAVIARVKEWEEEFGDLEVTTMRSGAVMPRQQKQGAGEGRGGVAQLGASLVGSVGPPA